MRKFLLVFDEGNGTRLDLRSFVEALDDNAEIYSVGGHAWFIKSNLDVSRLTDKFGAFAGTSLFFITELGEAEYAGRMVGPFWDFIKERTLVPSA